MKLRTVIGALGVIAATSGCTSAQVRAWMAWHEDDPDAAVEFAQRPEIVAELASSDGPQFAQHLAADGVTPGDCESYWPLMASYGLPRVFVRIAYRESMCDHTRFTDDRDDLGGYLTGLNFRTANLRAGWARWCGATLGNIRYDPELQVRCTAEAYQRMGMAPWS